MFSNLIKSRLDCAGSFDPGWPGFKITTFWLTQHVIPSLGSGPCGKDVCFVCLEFLNTSILITKRWWSNTGYKPWFVCSIDHPETPHLNIGRPELILPSNVWILPAAADTACGVVTFSNHTIMFRRNPAVVQHRYPCQSCMFFHRSIF